MKDMEKPIVVVQDPIFLTHNAGVTHIESPKRLEAIYQRLEKADIKPLYKKISPRAATIDELLWNHSQEYIERVAQTKGIEITQFDPDTYAGANSWDAAVNAVGACFNCLDELKDNNFYAGFALVRPPGHHAEYSKAKGFCLFNNIALAAHYVINKIGASRVLIVDFDLHHGNGTQWSFYENPNVVYFSTHQFPYYPGTGSLDEVGKGDGEGFTVNIPLFRGVKDGDIASIYEQILMPIAYSYNPDFILVSAGFDIYKDDPLGGFQVSIQGFSIIANYLFNISKRVCPGHLFFVLEGGYNMYGLSEGVASIIKEISINQRDMVFDAELSLSPSMGILETIAEVKKVYSNYWQF